MVVMICLYVFMICHYRVNFAFISKKDAFNLIKNAVIMGEKGTL